MTRLLLSLLLLISLVSAAGCRAGTMGGVAQGLDEINRQWDGYPPSRPSLLDQYLYRPLPEYRPLEYRQPLTCTSNRIGGTVFTNCY